MWYYIAVDMLGDILFLDEGEQYDEPDGYINRAHTVEQGENSLKVVPLYTNPTLKYPPQMVETITPRLCDRCGSEVPNVCHIRCENCGAEVVCNDNYPQYPKRKANRNTI